MIAKAGYILVQQDKNSVDPDQMLQNAASSHGLHVFGRVFKKSVKNTSFKKAMYGRAAWHQASSKVYLLVNRFSKLYVTFILQWIAFISGRDEEEAQ